MAGIDERLEEENETYLLDGIKLDIPDDDDNKMVTLLK